MSGQVTATQFTVDISAPLSLGNGKYIAIPGGYVGGSTTEAFPAPVWFQFNDQVASVHPVNGVLIRHTFGGGNMTGGRNGLMSYISLPASPSASDTSNKNYVAGLFQGYAAAPADPTKTGGPLLGGYAGGWWGINPNVWLAAGATNFYGIYGAEIDIAVNAGASVAEKYGLIVVQSRTDAVHGSVDDAAVAILNQPSAIGWQSGLQFGGAGSVWPFTATSTLIYAKPQQQPHVANAPALNGVDLRSVQFSGDAFASPGFAVDGTGNIHSTGLASRNFANDIAAAAGGVAVGDLYHNAGSVRIRLT